MEEDECDYVATEKEILDCELDIVAGEKVDSLWLILDNKYILIKNRPFKDGKAVWECGITTALSVPSTQSRHFQCPKQ